MSGDRVRECRKRQPNLGYRAGQSGKKSAVPVFSEPSLPGKNSSSGSAHQLKQFAIYSSHIQIILLKKSCQVYTPYMIGSLVEFIIRPFGT